MENKKRGVRKHGVPRYQSGSRYYRILEDVSMGDLFVGFLSSAGSSRLMHRVAAKRAYERNKNRLALERLEQCGYIRHEVKNGEMIFFATREGKQALYDVYRQTSETMGHPERWDGSWRVVAYDFPEEERSRRNSLRYILSKSGYLQIQKSVWIFPYDVSLLTELLAKDVIIAKHTVFMKASVSGDKKHKKHFKIS